jgi:uncharacterized RDD family membrane protein YckC
MIRVRRRALPVAPIPRRLLASLIDTVLAILVGILAIGAYARAAVMRGRKTTPRMPSLPKLASSKRARIVLRVCAFVLNVLLVGRRGPGSRIVGIRLVDARTGGPVSLRQATLRVGAQRGWRLLVRWLTGGRGKTGRPEQLDLPSKVEELKREHGDDREAFRQAMMAIYKENRAQPHPYRALLPVLMQLPLGMAIEIPALLTTLHQGLPDTLAGTIVISDR